MTYQPLDGCGSPQALLFFPFADRARQLELLARAVADFPEFHVGKIVAGDEHSLTLREAHFVPGGRYARPGEPARWPLWVTCSDPLVCAEFAWLVGVALDAGMGLGCDTFPDVQPGQPLSLPSPSASLPPGPLACARSRTCTTQHAGAVWPCATFEDEDVARCANAPTCADVFACMKTLNARGRPHGPKPPPALEPPGR